MRLASPAITLPNSGIASPRLTFEHYFATEFGFDGGNVKISINGGAYALVPASAFIFNPYNATMATAAAGNTSPLPASPDSPAPTAARSPAAGRSRRST